MMMTQALPGHRFSIRSGARSAAAAFWERLRARLVRGHAERELRAWLGALDGRTLADLGLDRQEMLYAPPELIEPLADWRRGG